MDDVRGKSGEIEYLEGRVLMSGDPSVVPVAPDALAAVAQSQKTINLKWTDLADNEDGVTVERKLGAGDWQAIATLGVDVTQYSDRVLTAGTSYSYRVREFNGAVFSDYSDEANATTIAQTTLPALKMSSNGHWLVHADGTPFFWLGDTAWRSFGLTDDQLDMYLADRAAKGFNVIQGNVIVDLAVAPTNVYGDSPLLNNDPNTPNEEYFQHLDHLVDQAGADGLYVAIPVTWGDQTSYFTPASANSFGKFLGNRYKNDPNVIWVVSGEYGVPEMTADKATIFNAIGSGLDTGAGGKALITIHPRALRYDATDFANASWLDFYMLQTWNKLDAPNYVTTDYNRTPAKPTLSAETSYEGPGNQDDMGMRRFAYWNVFAGALGHTYGADDVWNMTANWQNALNRPGASQMQYLRKLMESRAMLKLVPDQSMFTQGAGAFGTAHLQGIRANDGSYLYAYDPDGHAFNLNMARMSSSTVYASWYNPRTGQYSTIGTLSNTGTHFFIPPTATNVGAADWVLVLDNKQAALNAPANLVADPIGPKSIKLTWDDNSDIESGYKIERSTDGGATWAAAASVAANSKSYTDKNLVMGATYTYRVRAFNAFASTGYTNTSGASLPIVPLADLTVSNITWDVASPAMGDSLTFSATITNNGTAATPDGVIHGISFLVDGAQISWSDTDVASLAPGESVTLTANGGPSGATWTAAAGNHVATAVVDDIDRITELSETNNTTTAPIAVAGPPAPKAPTVLGAAAVSAGQINLSWTDGSTDETGFKIDRSTSADFTSGVTTISVAANTIAYQDKNLSPTTKYYYRVRATGVSTDSDFSNVVNAMTQSPAPPPTPNGLTATYFDNANFTGKSLSRVDGTVNFNWGTGAPASGFGVDTYSARWTGQVLANFSQQYTFYTTSDDGVRLWVNGQLIINNWTQHGPTENSGKITLAAGKRYDIKMEYYENGGGAVAQLRWSAPSVAKNVIPATNLFVYSVSPPVTPPPPAVLPDLVVTDISWPSTIKPGQKIRFTATVMNVGAGATPAGVINGVSFLVDGVQVSWSSNNSQSLAPGQSVTLTSSGGASVNGADWIATQGNHTIVAVIDDVNRMAESNESNNTLSKSLLITNDVPLVIPAMTYADSSPISNDGTALTALDPGDWVRFDNVNFGAGYGSADLSLASVTPGQQVDLHLDSVDGPVIGTLITQSSGSTGTFKTQRFSLSAASGVHNVFLVFSGNGEVGNLASLTLHTKALTRIMTLGDSITLPPYDELSYRYYLYKTLESNGYFTDFVGTLDSEEFNHFDYDRDNEGHPGYKAQDILANVDSYAAADRPDVVLLHLGTNDINTGESVASTITELGQIIDRLRVQNPKVTILLAQIIPMNNSKNGNVIQLNSQIASLVASKNTALSKVIVVDQYSGKNINTDYSDTLHLNGSGDAKMATAWYAALKGILPV